MSMSIKRARMATQGSGRAPGRPMGDPGLLGGIIGGIGGFLTGGPAGAIAGAVGGFRGGSSPSSPPRSGPGISIAPPQEVRPQPGIGGLVRRVIPGGRTGLEVTPATATLACPKGYRPNKTEYFLKDGTFVPKGSRCVKVRTRNAMNPRALSRAISRVNMGKRWQAKLAEISTGKYTATGKKKDC